MADREEFLITTSVDGHERPSVWNTAEQGGIDYPERWHIKRSATGFTLTHVQGKALRITEDMIGPDAYFELPQSTGDPRKVYVKLQKLRPIRPAFLPVALPAGVQYGPSQVFASAGVREYLIGFQPVEGTYKALVEKDAIFQLARGPSGDFQILALRAGVRFKVFGQKSKPIPPGVPLGFRAQDASRSAILWGSYWWRFNQVPTPEVLPPDEREEEELDADSRAFKQLGKTIGTVMLVVLLAVKFLYHAPPEHKEEKPVSIDLQKPHVIPTPTPPKLKPPEPEKPKPKPPEPPKPKPKKEKPKPPPPKPKPKPEPPKPKPRPEPPKPKLQPKPVPKPPVPPKKVTPPPKIVPPAIKPPPVLKPPPVAAPPKPAVTAAPPKPDPTKVAKAALSKSLSFLSAGPSSKVNPFTTVPTQKFVNRYSNMGAGAIQAATSKAGASILNKLATSSNADGPISTTGARNINSSLSLGGSTRGKALNDVQGKVSIPQLYSGDAGAGIGEALNGNSGVSITGQGKMSDALIEKILAKHLAKFQYCYEKALLSDPSLAGQIVFQWTIAPGGSVSGVKVVRSQMNNAKLHQCISSELGRISFSPGPTGGSVVIQHPFAFSASSL